MIKYVVTAGMVFSCWTAPGLAVEKPPPVSIEELKDPKSGSFVPNPYPRTKDEVIADYVSLTRTSLELKAAGKVHQKLLGGQNPIIWEMQKALVSPRSTLKFGELVSAKDETVTSPYRSSFVLEVIDTVRNQVVGYVVVADTGLPRMDIRIQEPGETRRFRREYEVRRLFAEKFGIARAIRQIEAVFVRGDFQGALPVWRARSAGSTFYLGNDDSPGGQVWHKLRESVPVPEDTYFMSTTVERPVQVGVGDRFGNLIEMLPIPAGTVIVLDELGGFLHILDPVK